MKIILDNYIKIKNTDLLPNISKQIKNALTFENEEKILGKKEHLWGWQDLPDNIHLYSESNGHLILPRGFTQNLIQGLKDFNTEFELEDHRSESNIESYFFSSMKPINLRPYQEDAVNDILKHQQGTYQAPSGSGKTLAALEAIRRSGQRSIIIVNKKNIAEQWRIRAKEFMGINFGLIGDGIWDELPITVAMQQTLYSSQHELLPDWWKQWGLVLLDESHGIVQASTYQDIIQKFPAKYRFGLSATPKKGSINPISQCIIGPIFHVTKHETLQKHNILVEPHVEIVETDYTYSYTSTIKVNNWENCPIQGCYKDRYHIHRNNYTQMMDNIVKNVSRNSLITEKILINRGHCNLVISRRLNHLNALRELASSAKWPSERLFMLTGKESREERQRVVEKAEESDVVIFSTIADEALDIPRLDRIYLIYPTKNPDLIKQQIGRIERSHPDKQDSVIYDFYDKNVGVLKNQFYTRKTEVYEPRGLVIKS